MANFLCHFLVPMAAMLVWGMLLSGLLMLLPRQGRVGRRVSDWLAHAPALDVMVAGFTLAPWVVGAIFGRWLGLAGVIVGQFLLLFVWVSAHEWMHRQVNQGPRIVKTLNRLVGRWRNHGALWVTLIALPGFWLIRLYEILVYPLLIWILRFPRYRHRDWINVSRQKFEGLIGHDLIWCLYCDWMTGVWCLGGEMLRNVESFWCPIRFYSGKKCDNCRHDFPDIDRGWVRADGNLAQVQQTLEQYYGDGRREWFNHPARLTIRGQPIDPPKEPRAE